MVDKPVGTHHNSRWFWLAQGWPYLLHVGWIISQTLFFLIEWVLWQCRSRDASTSRTFWWVLEMNLCGICIDSHTYRYRYRISGMSLLHHTSQHYVLNHFYKLILSWSVEMEQRGLGIEFRHLVGAVLPLVMLLLQGEINVRGWSLLLWACDEAVEGWHFQAHQVSQSIHRLRVCHTSSLWYRTHAPSLGSMDGVGPVFPTLVEAKVSGWCIEVWCEYRRPSILVCSKSTTVWFDACKHHYVLSPESVQLTFQWPN